MINQGLFTSATDEWATPQDFFDALNDEFHFTLDVCANEQNHKCERYFSKADDGLKMDWGGGRLYGATHRMAERSASGWRSVLRTTVWLLCCYLRAQTRAGFTTSSTRSRRSDLSKDGSSLAEARTLRRFQVWLWCSERASDDTRYFNTRS